MYRWFIIQCWWWNYVFDFSDNVYLSISHSHQSLEKQQSYYCFTFRLMLEKLGHENQMQHLVGVGIPALLKPPFSQMVVHRTAVMILNFRTDRSVQGAVWSGSTLLNFSILSALCGQITLLWMLIVQFIGWLQQLFPKSEVLGFLWWTIVLQVWVQLRRQDSFQT